MRLFFYFLIAGTFLITGFDQLDNDKKKVKQYIQELKQENLIFLPKLNISHIPYLLEAAGDTTKVAHYPGGSFSSYHYKEYSLGMILLWTVESIRMGRMDKRRHERAVTGNPLVYHLPEKERDHSKKSHDTVLEAYRKWWEKNKNKSPAELKESDPLKDTEYSWLSVHRDDLEDK